MAEPGFNAPDSKSDVPLPVPGVRIPLSPPSIPATREASGSSNPSLSAINSSHPRSVRGFEFLSLRHQFRPPAKRPGVRIPLSPPSIPATREASGGSNPSLSAINSSHPRSVRGFESLSLRHQFQPPAKRQGVRIPLSPPSIPATREASGGSNPSLSAINSSHPRSVRGFESLSLRHKFQPPAKRQGVRIPLSPPSIPATREASGGSNPSLSAINSSHPRSVRGFESLSLRHQFQPPAKRQGVRIPLSPP